LFSLAPEVRPFHGAVVTLATPPNRLLAHCVHAPMSSREGTGDRSPTHTPRGSRLRVTKRRAAGRSRCSTVLLYCSTVPWQYYCAVQTAATHSCCTRRHARPCRSVHPQSDSASGPGCTRACSCRCPCTVTTRRASRATCCSRRAVDRRGCTSRRGPRRSGPTRSRARRHDRGELCARTLGRRRRRRRTRRRCRRPARRQRGGRRPARRRRAAAPAPRHGAAAVVQYCTSSTLRRRLLTGVPCASLERGEAGRIWWFGMVVRAA
jgi:hypothetical protein